MINLIHGDCLEKMRDIPDGSVDLILTDPPYGTIACEWDSIIPLDEMWIELNRIIKPHGPTVLMASQPFTTTLISSNMKMFKYCWIWNKLRSCNFYAAKLQPLNNTEDIVIFSSGGCNNGTKNPVPYNPQGTTKIERNVTNGKSVGGQVGHAHHTTMKEGTQYFQDTTGYPTKILNYKSDNNCVHPTQKPVALMAYLIETYTNEGETVLDFTMGSGTTGVACMKTNRNFIGIELDEAYFKIAESRIHHAPVKLIF